MINLVNQLLMNIEEILDDCLARPAVTGGYPFDENSPVLKIIMKLFQSVTMANTNHRDYPV